MKKYLLFYESANSKAIHKTFLCFKLRTIPADSRANSDGVFLYATKLYVPCLLRCIQALIAFFIYTFLWPTKWHWLQKDHGAMMKKK